MVEYDYSDYYSDEESLFHYDKNTKKNIRNIYDFIEFGVGVEYQTDILKPHNSVKSYKKCYFLENEDKNEFRLYDQSTDLLVLFAKWDEYGDEWKIYTYEPCEHAYKFSSPKYILKMHTDSTFEKNKIALEQSFVLWNTGCEGCEKSFQRICSSLSGKIRQQLMFIEHYKQNKNDIYVNMLRTVIPSFDDKNDRIIWCPKTHPEIYNYPHKAENFSFCKVDAHAVEKKKFPPNSTYIRTKFPEWNHKERTFMLDFDGRIKKRSIRNFQMMNENKVVVFQFGKYESKTYVLDFKYPFNIVQAFALGLCSSRWKNEDS